QDVLVYADDFLFSERIYMRKVEKGEMSITISLDGEAYYRQDISGDRIFGQSCGNLDSTTKILYIQLAPANGLVQPLKLTKEEIESFVDASGNLLRARYTVEILPAEVSF
ncbi:MAG: hypothetical protein NZ521_08280, partial [Flammeovirgaceae bacterium]|nr:hypothetical protein [Flammeovirgaceae bacterium]MDW8288213.1 hypothetical protein [Flammeovirgaceae bacterium]